MEWLAPQAIADPHSIPDEYYNPGIAMDGIAVELGLNFSSHIDLEPNTGDHNWWIGSFGTQFPTTTMAWPLTITAAKFIVRLGVLALESCITYYRYWLKATVSDWSFGIPPGPYDMTPKVSMLKKVYWTQVEIDFKAGFDVLMSRALTMGDFNSSFNAGIALEVPGYFVGGIQHMGWAARRILLDVTLSGKIVYNDASGISDVIFKGEAFFIIFNTYENCLFSVYPLIGSSLLFNYRKPSGATGTITAYPMHERTIIARMPAATNNETGKWFFWPKYTTWQAAVHGPHIINDNYTDEPMWVNVQ
jgi:hypothetical protein